MEARILELIDADKRRSAAGLDVGGGMLIEARSMDARLVSAIVWVLRRASKLSPLPVASKECVEFDRPPILGFTFDPSDDGEVERTAEMGERLSFSGSKS